MRKPLILTLLLALAAVPAVAQQAELSAPEQAAVVAVAAEVQSVNARESVTERPATLHVTRDEVREVVRQREDAREEQQITRSSTWVTVAVVAAAVAVALILLR